MLKHVCVSMLFRNVIHKEKYLHRTLASYLQRNKEQEMFVPLSSNEIEYKCNYRCRGVTYYALISFIKF